MDGEKKFHKLKSLNGEIIFVFDDFFYQWDPSTETPIKDVSRPQEKTMSKSKRYLTQESIFVTPGTFQQTFKVLQELTSHLTSLTMILKRKVVCLPYTTFVKALETSIQDSQVGNITILLKSLKKYFATSRLKIFLFKHMEGFFLIYMEVSISLNIYVS